MGLGWEHVTPVTKWWAGNPRFFVESLSPWMVEGAIGFVCITFEWTCMNTLKQKLCFKWLQTYICWMFLQLFVIMLFAFVWCVALLAGFRTFVCMFCMLCMFLHVVLACCSILLLLLLLLVLLLLLLVVAFLWLLMYQLNVLFCFGSVVGLQSVRGRGYMGCSKSYMICLAKPSSLHWGEKVCQWLVISTNNT